MAESTIAAKISDIKPIRDITYEHLRQEIIDGRVKPDDRLIERDIADRLNVSRTPVREALRRLESEGFVEYLPRKGVVVRGFNIAEIKEIYDIRIELECLAIRKAIENITASDVQLISTILANLEKTDNSDNINATVECLKDLDGTILRIANMPLLESLIGSLRNSLTRYKKINLSQAPRRSSAISEHKAILRATIAKDVAKAVSLVKQHIENARTELLKRCNFGER